MPTLVPLAIGAGSGPSNLRDDARIGRLAGRHAVTWIERDTTSGTVSCAPSHTGASTTVSPALKIVVLVKARKPHSMQPRRLRRALGHRAEAVDHQDQAPPVAHRRRRLAEAALLGVAGLETIDARRALEHAIAVVLV